MGKNIILEKLRGVFYKNTNPREFSGIFRIIFELKKV
jgi:hypothetical protein